jgi:hypothetical protein
MGFAWAIRDLFRGVGGLGVVVKEVRGTFGSAEEAVR